MPHDGDRRLRVHASARTTTQGMLVGTAWSGGTPQAASKGWRSATWRMPSGGARQRGMEGQEGRTTVKRMERRDLKQAAAAALYRRLFCYLFLLARAKPSRPDQRKRVR